MGAVFKSMEPIKELLCLWHFQVKGNHFAWLVLVSTRTMEVYRSDAPFTVGGCKSGEDFKFNKWIVPFPSAKARSVSWRAHPQYCNIIQDVTCLQSMEKPCYSFVSKTLRASPVHQATANVTTLKRDSVKTNRAEGWMSVHNCWFVPGSLFWCVIFVRRMKTYNIFPVCLTILGGPWLLVYVIMASIYIELLLNRYTT